jgi:polar amino acid transport system substrate-binding protein
MGAVTGKGASSAKRSRGASSEDRPHLGGAVAVAVRLDHGEDLAVRSHEPAHGAHVGRGGVEVDLEGGGAGRARRRHGSHGRLLIGENTRMLRLGIAWVDLIVLTSGAMATETTPAVRSELAPTGKLRIGLNHGNFLLVTPGSSATEPRGVASDIGRELGRRVGVPVEFIKFDTAGKLGDGVKSGVWDVAFLGAEPQRAAEIAFTAAYLEIPATYIVPAGSPIRSVAEVDREGVRIAVTEQSAYGLYLSRNVKHARLVLTKSGEAAVEAFVKDKLEALAGLRPALLTDVKRFPGARVLDGQFTAVQQAIGTPKSRAAAAKYLSAFVEEIKASGLVAEAISRNAVQGVSVAPAR